ncbi:MAG: hypothetical protein ACK5UE_03650 [Chitinophagales bacterium]|jgi:hypothetical protein|nr:hypothetical protein [Sphingobacteriales bacterium]
MKWYAYALLLGLWMVSGCCKDDPCNDDTNPNCPNYNPCKNVKEPTGKISRSMGHSDIWSDSFGDYDMGDTILFTRSGGNYIAIRCLDTGCTYEWTIGSEKIYEQGFVRQNVPANTPIEVTLKVTLKDPINCIPIDKRTKTTKRTFFGIENYEGKIYNYYGRWKGYYTDEPTKEVIVEFKTDKVSTDVAILTDRIPQSPYCRKDNWVGGFVDTITNIPYLDDETYIGRHFDYTRRGFSNWILGGEYIELNLMYSMNHIFTKKICTYNPIYQPSIQIYLPSKDKIQIDVQGVPAWKSRRYDPNEILFKRTFIGSRI